MNRGNVDPCVLIQSKLGKLTVLVILQVDDRLVLGTEKFLAQEEDALKKIKNNERKFLKNKRKYFNELKMKIDEKDHILTSQSDKIDKLKIPNIRKDLSSQRAMT